MKTEEISIDDFIKIDMRIGTIVSAELVEKSNKLLKLLVDFGDEIGKKQILSGIAQKYSAESLVGKKITAIINLKHREIMGMESCGMVLAAGEEAALIVPLKEVNNGERII